MPFLSDLLGNLIPQQPANPFGGPVLPNMPRPAVNAMTSPVLGPHNVPYLNPAEGLNALTQSRLAPSEIALRQAQSMLAGANAQFALSRANILAHPEAIQNMLQGIWGVGGGQPMAGAGSNGSAFGGQLSATPAGGQGDRATFDQWHTEAVNAGFEGDAADKAAAIAMAESGGNPNAVNLSPSEKGGSFGGMQINAVHPGAEQTVGNMPLSMKMAYDISNGGKDFSPWTMYKNGGYKKFLPTGSGGASARFLASTDQLPNADLGGAGATPYVPRFGGSSTPLSDTLATALNPVAAPSESMQVAAAGPTGITPLGNEAAPAPAAPQRPVQLAQAGPGPAPMPGGAPAFPAVPPGSLAPGGTLASGAATQQLRKAIGAAAYFDMLGMPTVAQAITQSVTQTPEWQAEVARQKTAAEAAAKLPFVGPTAAAEAAAKVPYTFGEVRPGTIQTLGGVPQFAAPVHEQVWDPNAGAYRHAFITPPLPGGGVGIPGLSGGAGGPAPGTGVSPAMPLSRPGPAQEHAMTTRATKEEDQRAAVINEANAAAANRATLLNMENDAGRFVQGPFADHVQEAATYLRLIDPSWNGQVSSYEDFKKNAGQLTRNAVRETSSRAAVQEFNLIANTLPQPTTSPQGFHRVQNELIGLTDFRLAKAQAQQQWEAAHSGSVAGFETTFQRQLSPYTFVVARMDQADRQELYSKLNQSAQGRQELKRLGEQLNYAISSGLTQ